MEITPELKERAVKVQEECHNDYSLLIKELPEVSFEDFKAVFIYRKLAELELKIEALEKRPVIPIDHNF